jgi:formylmethanofuran dehydrogenase subunit E
VIFDCANCHEKVSHVFRDKVSNKLVCNRCVLQAIKFGIRFHFDFEDIYW